MGATCLHMYVWVFLKIGFVWNYECGCCGLWAPGQSFTASAPTLVFKSIMFLTRRSSVRLVSVCTDTKGRHG